MSSGPDPQRRRHARRRIRSFRLLTAAALLAGLALSACGGDDGGATSADPGTGEGDCSLLGDDEVEAATGRVPSGSEAPTIGGGCTWFVDGDVALMVLDIGPDETIRDGEPASRYASTIERHDASGIESTDIDGLGDAANASGSPVPNNIVVRQGDEFLELTVNDGDALAEGTVRGLMETVISRR